MVAKMKKKTKDEDKTPGTVHAVELNQLLTNIKTKTKEEDKPSELDRMQSPERVPCCVEALASFYRSHTSVRHLGKEDMR